MLVIFNIVVDKILVEWDDCLCKKRIGKEFRGGLIKIIIIILSYVFLNYRLV